jgi:hypothetical protein
MEGQKMSKLYTSLVHAKLELNGGQLRPMTPVPEKHHDIIDPAFTIGLGALREEEGRGLQCPVRGCGRWMHRLTTHLNASHADVGGAARIKRVLSIPATTTLCSTAFSKKMTADAQRRVREGKCPLVRPTGEQRERWQERQPQERTRKRVQTRRANVSTTGQRNLLNTCEKQILNRVLDLQTRLGREVGYNDLRVEDAQLLHACERIYGSFQSAMIQVGIKTRRRYRSLSRDEVLDLVQGFYVATGRLPFSSEVGRRSCHPVMPAHKTVLRAFPGQSWPEIMDWAAWKLGVTDGRYGKPEYAKEIAC